MLDTITRDQPDHTAYPTSGVRISTQYHRETIGNHRLRIAIDPEVGDILRRGLNRPRLQIEGTVVNGLRVWCAEEGGLSPVINRSSGAWATTLPIRRVRAREAIVSSVEVPIAWERDDTGPVLLIPRVPDVLLPPEVIDKLPNSAVDRETRLERAEKRLQREMESLPDHPEPVHELVEAVQELVEPPEPISPTEPPLELEEPATAQPIEPGPPLIDDLRSAMQMVNEIRDQLGEDIALSIDDRGHVRARRRVIRFEDL